MAKRFSLAPMNGVIAAMTWFLLLLPLVFLISGQRALVGTAGLMLVLYAAVYLAWRPSRFEISPAELCIRFPIRRRTVPRGSIRTAEPIDSKQFRERFGRAVRVGVGGLWGGFGWLWTSKGWVEFYVSRTDAFVLLEREGMIPLLITPERPEEFARELGRKEDVAVPGG